MVNFSQACWTERGEALPPMGSPLFYYAHEAQGRGRPACLARR
jgi:hypothetical protein